MEYRERSSENDGVVTVYKVRDTVVSQKTTAVGQVIDLLRNDRFGLMLFIDGEGQSAENDEQIYHKSLVHRAMHVAASRRRVLILGGGEGATLREVLCYAGVDHVTMVDFDAELMELAQTYMPSWHKGSFADPRLNLVVEDVRQWVWQPGTPAPYDVILLDLPDAFAVDSILPKLPRFMHAQTIVRLQAGPSNIFERPRLDQLAAVLGPTYRESESPYIPFFQSPWAFFMHVPPTAASEGVVSPS